MARNKGRSDLQGWGDPVARGEIIKWEKGLVIIGDFVETRESQGQYKDSMLLDMEILNDKTGELVYRTIGCPRILASTLKQIKKGEHIRIECLGKVKSKNGMAWDFDVRKKK